MGKFSENLGKAADNAERLASALQSLPEAGSAAAGSVGGSSIPTQAVFNTTVNLPGGGGGGGGGGIAGGRGGGRAVADPFEQYVRRIGLQPSKLSSQQLAYLLREFERMLQKTSASGLGVRSGSVG